MESETLEICPYDPNHRMPASRLQYHLASRRKKNLRIAQKMANCKYNVCHTVPVKRLKEHEANCVNRTAVDDEPFNLPNVISLSLDPNEKLSNTANQILDPNGWNIDNMYHSPLFVLKTLVPKMLVREAINGGHKKETMDNKHLNDYKSCRKGQKN
ncbi:LOW QUALITY PROTEIN: gametocyte-specific factor 1-like [Suricata suricatta]|uniref:LOW QUALITY PROTEIN: gametocyte-specific factor 1-like n=1 Tax=Suricata suricatta TaxID=37032 RepID=UPI0011557F28|nr:LOW QUALITY PROTEIN: gametocyte-specific factor 1-like [Suricata suricatta]